METGQEPLVNTAAYLAKSIIYNNKERLLASLIVAGYDKRKGGQVRLSLIFIGFALIQLI
jgi:20S proteasome subunit beta 1